MVVEGWRQPQQTCVVEVVDATHRFGVGVGLDPLVYARLRYLLLRFLRIFLRFGILSVMTAWKGRWCRQSNYAIG